MEDYQSWTSREIELRLFTARLSLTPYPMKSRRFCIGTADSMKQADTEVLNFWSGKLVQASVSPRQIEPYIYNQLILREVARISCS